MSSINNQDNYDKQLLKEFQFSWSRQKYWVMSRSQKAYNTIRQLAKGNVWTRDKQQQYDSILLSLNDTNPTIKTLTVTYQHIWGYFKKSATKEEHELYLTLMLDVEKNGYEIEQLLKNLTQKYQESYLKNIRWMDE